MAITAARTGKQRLMEQCTLFVLGSQYVLCQQISDPTTTESLRAFIADLENRLRNLLDPE
jgi:hypothetical protein